MKRSTARSASVVTILNLKGGVGKTATAFQTAGAFHERGRRVLLIDCDAQANLTGSFLAEPDGQPGVEIFFDPAREPDLETLIRHTAFANIDLIPSTPGLSRYDLPDRSQWEELALHRALVEPLAELRSLNDIILIDCPPRLSVVSFAALCASDFALVPTEVADYGAQGLTQVKAAIADVRRRHNPRLQLLGLLPSRYRKARAYQQTYLDRLRAHFGDEVFGEPVPDLAHYEQSVCDRIPIVLHRPKSQAANLIRRLADEIERRIAGHAHGRQLGRRSHAHPRRPVAA